MRFRSPVQLGLIILLTLSLFFTASLAQSPPRKKKKIKDFGSSLKRLQWNSQKNAVVEIERTGILTRNSDEDDVIRIDTSLVTCDVLVVDRHGQNVSGLTAEDFVVTEDGELQKVGHFLLGNSATLPRTIVLIIDYSGSQRPYLESSVTAAKILVDKLGPYDQMAIVTDDVDLLVNFTDDKKKLKKHLDELVERTRFKKGFFGIGSGIRFGRSAQYSALLATLREAFDDDELRPIVVFQTDGDELLNLRNSPIVPTVAPGLPPDLYEEDEQVQRLRRQAQQDNLRDYSIDDVYRAAENSRATIYTVIPGYKLIGLTPDQQVERMRVEDDRRLRVLETALKPEAFTERKAYLQDRRKRTPVVAVKFRARELARIQSALAEVATLAGGWTEFLESPLQANDIYSRILSDINQRYMVGYYPSNKEHDGKLRKIDFKVKGHPDYSILGRRSYFAPSR